MRFSLVTAEDMLGVLEDHVGIDTNDERASRYFTGYVGAASTAVQLRLQKRLHDVACKLLGNKTAFDHTRPNGETFCWWLSYLYKRVRNPSPSPETQRRERQHQYRAARIASIPDNRRKYVDTETVRRLLQLYEEHKLRPAERPFVAPAIKQLVCVVQPVMVMRMRCDEGLCRKTFANEMTRGSFFWMLMNLSS